MNPAIFEEEVQRFIKKHEQDALPELILKGSPFKQVSIQEIAQQIAARKKAKVKLPTWYATPGIYFPPQLNLAQTSSEVTAAYKAQCVSGESLADLTGGFGVDSFYFSQYFKKVTHFETQEELAKIAQANFQKLSAPNISSLTTDSLTYLNQTQNTWDCLYLDPARRDRAGQKVFSLAQCTPNVLEHLDLLFSKTKCVLLKTSPLLDIKLGLKELKGVQHIHCVAVNNELKELLWVLKKEHIAKPTVPQVHCVNFFSTHTAFYKANLDEESSSKARLGPVLKYLYEPNVSLLKAGFFNHISQGLELQKLAQHTHLYTSQSLIDFPGRVFKVIQREAFNKKAFKKLNIKKANISARNFPLSVAQIRKKYGIKEGGEIYIFCITNHENQKVILVTQKV